MAYAGQMFNQLKPAQLDWNTQAEIESHIIAASQRGLQTILVIRSTPAWAQKNPGSALADQSGEIICLHLPIL
jgi:hypothetical protein